MLPTGLASSCPICGSPRIPKHESRWRRSKFARRSDRDFQPLVDLEPIRKMTGLRDSSKEVGNDVEQDYQSRRKIALELSRAERELLLTGLVYLHKRVDEEIRSTSPGVPVKISLGDLDDMAGHVAGEANHAKSERTEEILGGLFEKIEELLALYAKQ
jgi:hypothetical protein